MAKDNPRRGGNATRARSDSPLEKSKSVVEYLDRIGGRLTGVRTAGVFEEDESGYERQRARITFERDGSVSAPIEFQPNEKEAADLKAELPTLRAGFVRVESGWIPKAAVI